MKQLTTTQHNRLQLVLFYQTKQNDFSLLQAFVQTH